MTGLVAIDVGSSTGGFTDVLLKGGATKVYAVDSGTNQARLVASPGRPRHRPRADQRARS
ncbi:SAM-dependent methyltransferase [Sphingomonas aurantiaca]|uniref:SAM-dependent methyltransferase n=1 Tax=Sphingomonas aurantiaca TaxID=185949 RepID=UPI003A5B993F